MAQYDDVREILLAKQRELSQRLENIKSNITRGQSADSQEQAQELENAEVVDALGNETQHELHLIARALDQIRNDAYGDCGSCGKAIPQERLKVYPYADKCIGCATAAESGRRP